MAIWETYYEDKGWLSEGIVMFFETGNREAVKTIAGKRDGQTLILPTEGTVVSAKDELLLKFRHKSRCFFCHADIIDVNEEQVKVFLPQKYHSLARPLFQRHAINLPGKLDDHEVVVSDISMAGAAIQSQSTRDLELEKWYKFQMARFKTFVRIREINGRSVRLQFTLQDNLNKELGGIVHQRHSRFTRGHRRTRFPDKVVT